MEKEIRFESSDDPIVSLINRKENQILVNSCIYYRFNDNLISDYQYDNIGLELIELSKKYPEKFKQSFHYQSFKDYVTSECPSGFNLPFNTPDVVKKAIHLLKLKRSKEGDIR